MNEFRHVIAMEERRNVYYVPLNILDNVELPEEACSSIKVEVIDENIKGNIYGIEPDIYYGETDPSEVFTLHSLSICSDYGSRRVCKRFWAFCPAPMALPCCAITA